MIERDDVLDDIQKDLNVEPSASFAAGVRRRIDCPPAKSFVSVRGWAGALTVAVILALVVGWTLREQQVPLSSEVVTARRALVPGPAPSRVLEAPRVEERSRSRTGGSSAHLDDSARVVKSSRREFDPFRDVLVPDNDAHRVRLFVADEGENQLSESRSSSIDEPVTILALTALPRLVIEPLGEGAESSTSN